MEQLRVLCGRSSLIQERLYLYGEQLRRALSDLTIGSLAAENLVRAGLNHARANNYRESLRGWELLQEQWTGDQVLQYVGPSHTR